MVKKKPTEFQLDCPCGSKAQVFQTGESRYMGHCACCGCLTFFDNAALLERLKVVGKICFHRPEKKPCRGGWTTWCKRCRVRVFFYEDEKEAVGSPFSSGKS